MNLLFISNKTLGHYNTLERIIENQIQLSNNNILFINNVNPLVNSIIKKKYNLLIINCFNFIKIFYLIFKFKPDYIVSCSGNIAFVVCFFTSLLKYFNIYIPNIIIEQNYFPGKSTVIGSSIYDTIICPNKQTQRFITNPILVGDIKPFLNNNDNLINKQDKSKQTILILSGTLGYKKLTQAIVDNIELFDDYNIIFQTGKHTANFTNPNIKVFKNIENVKEYYNLADIIIATAGATTISELLFIKKPFILFPCDFVINNHQMINAINVKKISGCPIATNSSELKSSFIKLTQNYNDFKIQLNSLDNNYINFNLVLKKSGENIKHCFYKIFINYLFWKIYNIDNTHIKILQLKSKQLETCYFIQKRFGLLNMIKSLFTNKLTTTQIIVSHIFNNNINKIKEILISLAIEYYYTQIEIIDLYQRI